MEIKAPNDANDLFVSKIEQLLQEHSGKFYTKNAEEHCEEIYSMTLQCSFFVL